MENRSKGILPQRGLRVPAHSAFSPPQLWGTLGRKMAAVHPPGGRFVLQVVEMSFYRFQSEEL